MTSLIFKPEDHTYWLGDRRVPSVTQVIGFSEHAPDYSNVPVRMLEKKATLGRLVHKTIEDYFEHDGDLFTDDPRANTYLDGFIQFINSGVYTHIFSESRFYHPTHYYAGTIDLIGEVNGKLSVLDIKTTYNLHIDPVSLQLAAYGNLVSANLDVTVEKSYAIHLKGNGVPKLVPMEDAYAYGKFLRARRKLEEEHGY